MVWTPVFRGTDPQPLWILRSGSWYPAWATDPCDADCCPQDCADCSQLQGCLATAIQGDAEVTFAGVADNPPFCLDCDENMNTSYFIGGPFSFTEQSLYYCAVTGSVVGTDLCSLQGITSRIRFAIGFLSASVLLPLRVVVEVQHYFGSQLIGTAEFRKNVSGNCEGLCTSGELTDIPLVSGPFYCDFTGATAAVAFI